MITAAAQDGDRFAIEQFERLGQWLGHGIASLVAVLDPAVVVIGGGVSEAGALLIDPLRASFEHESERTWLPPDRGDPARRVRATEPA
ncbi:ROK family protein [Nocardioides convexus]|uniref:ROK family protein n=1 Tax=Nocardioides convexus TaxID=2712224 RepID=UPI0024189214|nr:ROK family protein [Nocardioides convexus]